MNSLWEFIEGGYQQTEAYNPYFTDILIYSPGILAIEPGCDRDSLLFALNPGAEVLCNNNLESLELIRPHPSGGRGFLHLNLWYTEHYVLRGSRTGLNTIWNQLFIHTPHSLFFVGRQVATLHAHGPGCLGCRQDSVILLIIHFITEKVS